MLITTLNTNGKITIKLHKDWHVDRIGKAYVPPAKNNQVWRDSYNLQTALLRKR